MNCHEIGKEAKQYYQIEIREGSDILFHPKGKIKIFTRTTDKCPNSEKIINEFYERFDDILDFIFVKEVLFDDKNGNIGSIEIDYFSQWKKSDYELIQIGRKTLDELWLDGYALILKWNVKFLDEI